MIVTMIFCQWHFLFTLNQDDSCLRCNQAFTFHLLILSTSRTSYKCNYLPFFKPSVFVLFDSCFILWVAWLWSQGIRILCTFDTDPLRLRFTSDVLLLGNLSIVKCSVFHAVLFTVHVKRRQNVFLKKKTFGTTDWRLFPLLHCRQATVTRLNQSAASRNFFWFSTISLLRLSSLCHWMQGEYGWCQNYGRIFIAKISPDTRVLTVLKP